jgi:branched-chain amino acid transport system ATP-binding protein
MAEAPSLQCEGVDRSFGGLKALRDISLAIAPGQIFGLVGPNGSGKTTLVNAITGFYPPQRGRIRYEGRDITGAKPHLVARLGIARTYQNLALFRGMSVLDNILMGRHIYFAFEVTFGYRPVPGVPMVRKDE